jgi:chorismate-pyruvate lyase
LVNLLRLGIPVVFVLIWSTGFIVAKAVLPHADLQVDAAKLHAHRGFCTGWLVLLLALAAASAAGARDAASAGPFWPDTFLARVEALALLQTLNGELLSHDSATLTLEHWCAVHTLASPPRIVAERVTDVDKPPTAQQRMELGVTATEAVRYRRVKLRCGAVVLSEADNWYVPGRLTAEMNTLLDTTDAPFGKVVQALHFRRHTLSSVLLWSPLPEDWEMHQSAVVRNAARLPIPEHLLEHRAVLVLPDGTPFSEVVETYTGDVLAFHNPSLSRGRP